MNIKNYLTQVGILLAVAFVFAGCGKKTGESDRQAFEKAAPAIKSTWQNAVTADKNNDYYTAATAYNQLVAKESELTPKQFDAVLAASRDLMQRMIDAGNNGDVAAKQALAKLMAEQRQR